MISNDQQLAVYESLYHGGEAGHEGGVLAEGLAGPRVGQVTWYYLNLNLN